MNKKITQGLTLVEVLFSLFLISILLLGLLKSENESLRLSYLSWNVAVAANQIHTMYEYLTESDLNLEEKIKRWNKDNEFLLPHGQGEVTGKFPNYLIVITWGTHPKYTPCLDNSLYASCLSEYVFL